MELRLINEGELADYSKALTRGFGRHFDSEIFEAYRATIASSRALAAFDDGQTVGTVLSYPLQMYVPGGMLPTTLLDSVTVQPTHRRQGILTRMVDWLMNDFHDRGEILSCLGASESVIYGRFGYGPASLQVDFTLERPYANFSHFPEVNGRLRFVEKPEARELFPLITERACSERPGYLRGSDKLWDVYIADPEPSRDGAGALFMVVYEDDGKPDGYVTYRIRETTVIVNELMPVTRQAHAALWRFCFGVDLMRTTYAPKRPVDEPLPWMLADPRRLRQSVRDDLWLRLVDIREALGRRTYAAEGRLVIEVVDSFCPWNEGRYELDGGPAGADCKPTTSEPDLLLSAADLAAGYLGAISFTNLCIAGRAEERKQGSLELADTMFRPSQAPWWPNEF